MLRQILTFTFLRCGCFQHYVTLQKIQNVNQSSTENLHFYFCPEDGGGMFLQNTGVHIHNYMHVYCCRDPQLLCRFQIVGVRISHVFSKFFTLVGESRVDSKTKGMQIYLIKTLVTLFLSIINYTWTNLCPNMS